MQVSELPDAGARPTVVEFSPDGARLAAWADGRVFVTDTATGAARTLWNESDSGRAEGIKLGFTADGRFVLARHVSAGRAIIAVHDGGTGAVVRELELHGINDGFVPVPGGRTALVAVHPTHDGATAEFVHWNPTTGERSAPFARHRNVIRQLAISADGRRLAGTFGDTIRVWNLDGRKPPTRAKHNVSFRPGFAVCLALSADGAFAVAGGYRDDVRLIELDTGTTHTVGTRPRGYGRDIAFHPSRQVFAFSGADEDVVLTDATTRDELKRFAWGIGDVSAVAFSTDGLRCAAASSGKIVVWDVD